MHAFIGTFSATSPDAAGRGFGAYCGPFMRCVGVLRRKVRKRDTGGSIAIISLGLAEHWHDSASLLNQPMNVIQEKEEMHGIGWRRDEVKMLVEGSCLVVL
jgi:hypothetical protein